MLLHITLSLYLTLNDWRFPQVLMVQKKEGLYYLSVKVQSVRDELVKYVVKG